MLNKIHNAKSRTTARKNGSQLQTEGGSFQMRAIWQFSWSEQVSGYTKFGQLISLFAWLLET